MRELIDLFIGFVIPIFQKKIKFFIINTLLIYGIYQLSLVALNFSMEYKEVVPLTIVIFIVITIAFASSVNISSIYLTIFQLDKGKVFVPISFFYKFFPRAFAANFLLSLASAVILLMPYSLITSNNPLYITFGLLIALAIFIVNVLQILIDIIIVSDNCSAIRSIKKSILFFGKNFKKLLALFVISIIPLLLTFIASTTKLFPESSISVASMFFQFLVLCFISIPFKIAFVAFYFKYPHKEL